MMSEFAYACVIIACAAVVCQKIHYFIFVRNRFKTIARGLEEIVEHVKDVTGFVKRQQPDEWLARALLKEDVELMKQWTQEAFIETLNKRPPPEIPEKIIQRYGKAGDADWVFSRLKI